MARRATAKRAAVPPASVPATAYAILGMLSFGQTSGYDLGKSVEQSVAYFFSPAKSHIYAELRRLVELGWASERTVRQQDRPDKRLYRITAKGKQALRRWIEEPGDETDAFKSPTLLRLFFGHVASTESLMTQMKEYRAQAQARLDEFTAMEKQFADPHAALFPYLTLRCGIAHQRASLKWAEEVLRELEKR